MIKRSSSKGTSSYQDPISFTWVESILSFKIHSTVVRNWSTLAIEIIEINWIFTLEFHLHSHPFFPFNFFVVQRIFYIIRIKYLSDSTNSFIITFECNTSYRRKFNSTTFLSRIFGLYDIKCWVNQNCNAFMENDCCYKAILL